MKRRTRYLGARRNAIVTVGYRAKFEGAVNFEEMIHDIFFSADKSEKFVHASLTATRHRKFKITEADLTMIKQFLKKVHSEHVEEVFQLYYPRKNKSKITKRRGKRAYLGTRFKATFAYLTEAPFEDREAAIKDFTERRETDPSAKLSNDIFWSKDIKYAEIFFMTRRKQTMTEADFQSLVPYIEDKMEGAKVVSILTCQPIG